jgi:energy-coupling factor transporter ATP-binding protein EcfA2
MAYRSEIERALDEMVSDETGMKFQGLAVLHGHEKWPQLVACERKWDRGLDAHANGALQADGKGIGLASSITATLNKISIDAEEVKKHYPDVQVLIFSTALKVSKHEEALWAEEILDKFSLQLVVVSREELVIWLLDPAHADICRDQLGIAPSMVPELEPALKRAQEAAKETADNWDRTYRKPGRPVINLKAVKLDEHGNPKEAATTDSLGAELDEGQRMVLEAPAGSGKTTTLVQFARRVLTDGGLPFLVDLPGWVSSHRNILAFIADYPAFAARDLGAGLLSKLRAKQPATFLLNGWNEVSIANAGAADAALRELERSFPASIIVVTTRLHRLIPPLRAAFRVQLNQLDRAKRNEYLDRALGESAHDLKVKLDSNRTLNSITRTPLILAEVADLYRAGKQIPLTKMGVLGAVLHEIEESTEHRVALQQAPLRGHAADYLRGLSMRMTDLGETTIADSEARVVVNSVSDSLRLEGRVMSAPDPGEILDELSKRHVLVVSHQDEVTFRFQHQQFQEFYAAGGLGRLLLAVVNRNDAAEGGKFTKQYVNQPRWGESLRMLAEDIAERGAKAEFVEAGARLVRMALHVDPIFAAGLANASGPAVWAKVREDVGRRLRAWYAQKDPHHRQCALAAMLATGADDFKDIVVPLLADANDQVRLAVYHGGAEVLPANLGPNWRDLVRSWPEEARLNFVVDLARNPWFADNVEEIALADTSPKVRWNAAHMLSWYGFMEKVERLLKSLDDASLREVLRGARPDEIPNSQWPRIVAVYEQMYKEASDPFERLRLLHALQTFSGTNIVERMKAELDGLGPDQLKPGDNQGQIRWALDELQKSDPRWVSEWATRKVLDRSIWFGAWRGLITQISDEEAEALYSRFSSEVLDQGEQQRVVSVLVSVMNAALAARVFGRACEIRAGLSFPPGHDQAKWNLFGQVEDLLRAMSPAMLLDGVSEKLEKEPQAIELDILTDTLPATKLTKPDVRSSISEDMRVKLRVYLKRGARLGADPDGLRAGTRAHLAQLLANVGEREDLEDIRRLIEADSVRFEKAQAARMKGDRSHDVTGYGFLYLDAVTMVDPAEADGVVMQLIRSQQYEHVLSQRLPFLARRSTAQTGLGTNRMDFGRIWRARAGELDDTFVEERRARFSDAIREQIERIKTDREAATDKRGFDQRLKALGGALAALDGMRSAKLILELMELPGRWDGWTRVVALENLLVSGVRLSLKEVLRVLDPTMQELQSSGIYNDQNVWLFARCLGVMTFVDPASEGVANVREIVSRLRLPLHKLGSVVAALGASRCHNAIDVLMELAGPDGKGVEVIGEAWIEAIGALEGERSSEILLSFVDPNPKLFNREFIPDHRHGDLLARLLAERAVKDKALKGRLVEIANGDLPPTKRMLLAKVFSQFAGEDDRVEGLCILRDDGSGVPYEFVRSMESAFLEHRPYGPSSGAYTLSPRGCNAIRRRLFEMVISDPHRKESAFALLGQIEVWRLEHGHPPDEPRHPVIESEVSWPPFLS